MVERRLGGVALGDLLVDRGLVGFGLDGEQDLAFLHQVAVVELARPEEAFDAGAQLDLVDGGGAADELGLVGDRLQLGGLDQHGGRRRALLGPGRHGRKHRRQTRPEKRHYRETPLLHCHCPCSSLTSEHCLNSTKRSLYFREGKEVVMAVMRWFGLVLSLVFAFAASDVSAQTRNSFANPAEYDSYMAALNTRDAAKRATAMEVFVAWYPGSVLKIEALEQAIAAWHAANQPAKADVMAARLLQVDPDNVRALANRAYAGRTRAAAGDAAALAPAVAAAERGLIGAAQWQKPVALTDAAFARIREQMAGVFNGTLGFAALQAKDYDRRATLLPPVGRGRARQSPGRLPAHRRAARGHAARCPRASGTPRARSRSRAPPRTRRRPPTSTAMSAPATASIAAARKAGTNWSPASWPASARRRPISSSRSRAC